MNAITLHQPQAVPSFSMGEIETIASAIARGGLFASKDPYAVLTLCMLAQAEGQHPAIAFRDYHMISGKPSKKAEAMQRDFLAAGGRIEWHDLSNERVSATFSHPMGGTATIDWDIERAKTAGVYGTNANWKKYPRQMLKARVVSEGARTVFPAATSGLYVPEEVQDFSPEPAAPVAPKAVRARDAKELPAPDPDIGRQNAEKWAAEHIAAVEAASPSDFEGLRDNGAKAVRKLEKGHPDLHAKVIAAYNATADNFGDNGFTEGPSDTDRGESHAIDADFIIGHISAKVRETDVISLIFSHADTIAGFDEDDRARVAEAQTAKIAALRGRG